jgi:shikimate O-hydroxycinnamoyltransferase
MILEVEVISSEIIKPCRPTPDNLRYYQFSFLDQISPPVFNPLALFYQKDASGRFSNIDRSNSIKESLSEVLTGFYPLAGRIKENLYIDCNDQGTPYKEARVKCRVSDVMDNPSPGQLRKLTPFELDDASEFVSGVQLNLFECGGIAIGVCVSHNIGDALSMFTFVKTLAAISRGEKNIPRPEFISAKLFPPKNVSGFKTNIGIIKQNIVTKRFVFKSSEIESIQRIYKTLQEQKPPSRVEALSAFIWSRFVKINQPKPDKFYTVLHAVNLRPRINPSLPEHSFGNLYQVAITIPTINHEDKYCRGLVKQVREAIQRIDKDYIKKLQHGDEHLDFIRQRAKQVVRGELVSFNFTSLCRFPIYEADMGWGKPVWVGAPALTFKNLVTFLDTKSGNGIEVNISLDVKDMVKFEADAEFLSFVARSGC